MITFEPNAARIGDLKVFSVSFTDDGTVTFEELLEAIKESWFIPEEVEITSIVKKIYYFNESEIVHIFSVEDVVTQELFGELISILPYSFTF
jgi:hypothetical protein